MTTNHRPAGMAWDKPSTVYCPGLDQWSSATDTDTPDCLHLKMSAATCTDSHAWWSQSASATCTVHRWTCRHIKQRMCQVYSRPSQLEGLRVQSPNEPVSHVRERHARQRNQCQMYWVYSPQPTRVSREQCPDHVLVRILSSKSLFGDKKCTAPFLNDSATAGFHESKRDCNSVMSRKVRCSECISEMLGHDITNPHLMFPSDRRFDLEATSPSSSTNWRRRSSYRQTERQTWPFIWWHRQTDN